MRVIALIDDPRLVEKSLRHLGSWHDPPAGLPRPSATRPCAYEPYGYVDPMPDYENALTDSGALFGRPAGGLCLAAGFSRVGKGRAGFAAANCGNLGKTCMARLACCCPSPSLAGWGCNE